MKRKQENKKNENQKNKNNETSNKAQKLAKKSQR